MKKLLFFICLSSSLFAMTAEDFYKDTKKFISYSEGVKKWSDQEFTNIIYIDATLTGVLISQNFNKTMQLIYPDKNFVSLCLNQVTPYQLSKTLIAAVDQDPKLLRSNHSILIENVLLRYQCK